MIPTIAPYLMPRTTAAFAKKYPEAKLRIVEATTPVLIESLRTLSIDLAILALPLRHKDLELDHLGPPISVLHTFRIVIAKSLSRIPSRPSTDSTDTDSV